MARTTHERTLIRNAARTKLLNATRAGARVETTRIVPWQPSEMPGLAIYTLEENVDPASWQSAPRELRRHPELVLEGYVLVPNDGNIDDELDAFALEIEKAMHADDTLNGTVGDVALKRTELLLTEKGEDVIGVVRLVYVPTYFTWTPDDGDGSPLNDFAVADTKYNLQPGQEALNRAEDTLIDLDES
jgi:hypothetical protein